jgi:hypothetical protein
MTDSRATIPIRPPSPDRLRTVRDYAHLRASMLVARDAVAAVLAPVLIDAADPERVADQVLAAALDATIRELAA